MSMSNTEKTVKDIRRNTRRKFSTEEKIRIVLDGLRGVSSACSSAGLMRGCNCPIPHTHLVHRIDTSDRSCSC